MTKTHEPCATRGDCYHAKAGRIGGLIGGRRTIELHGNPATPEGRAKGARKTNETWGKIPEAHEARVCGARNQPREAKVRGGRIGGRRRIELHGSPGTPEGRAKGVRKNLESGQVLANAKSYPSVSSDGEYLMWSSDEAVFYGLTLEAGGRPFVPETQTLSDGRVVYKPDIQLREPIVLCGVLIPANRPIELKHRKTFYNGNLQKAIDSGALVLYYEDFFVGGPIRVVVK